MIEQVLFLIAITFLTLLAFLMVLMYFNIIKFDVKREIEIRKLSKEERKKGWLQLDLNINLFGWKIGNRKDKGDK